MDTPASGPSRWVDLLIALGLVVAFISLQVVMALALVIAVVLLMVVMNYSTEAAMRLAQSGVVAGGASALTGLLSMGLVWLAVSRAGRRPFRSPTALVPARGWPLWIYPLLALLLAILFDSVTILLGKPIVPETLLPLFQGLDAVVVMLLATVAVAPIVEELLFRGVLFGAIERFAPAWFAVVLTALAFGALHVMTYGLDGYTILQTLVMGLILGIMDLSLAVFSYNTIANAAQEAARYAALHPAAATGTCANPTAGIGDAVCRLTAGLHSDQVRYAVTLEQGVARVAVTYRQPMFSAPLAQVIGHDGVLELSAVARTVVGPY